MTDESINEAEAGAEGAATVVDQPGAEETKPKLQQTVDLQDSGPCKKHIKVTIERAEIDKLLKEKFKELVVDSNVAGFRPGKAPRQIVEKRFHKEVSDQVKAEILMQSLGQLAEDFDIAPLSTPNLDPFKIDLPKEGPMVYEFEVEVRPNSICLITAASRSSAQSTPSRTKS